MFGSGLLRGVVLLCVYLLRGVVLLVGCTWFLTCSGLYFGNSSGFFLSGLVLLCSGSCVYIYIGESFLGNYLGMDWLNLFWVPLWMCLSLVWVHVSPVDQLGFGIIWVVFAYLVEFFRCHIWFLFGFCFWVALGIWVNFMLYMLCTGVFHIGWGAEFQLCSCFGCPAYVMLLLVSTAFEDPLLF